MTLASQLLNELEKFGRIDLLHDGRLQVHSDRPVPTLLGQNLRKYRDDIVALLREPLEERTAIIQANGVPEEWAVGFAKLCTMDRPKEYDLKRWEQLVNDAGLFLDQWGKQAQEFGWSSIDVFGVHHDRPTDALHCLGLVPLLKGGRVVGLDTDAAKILTIHGASQTFRKRGKPQSPTITIWEIDNG